MTTRREFLVGLGKGTLGFMGLQFISGCETIDVTSKVPGERASFITPAEDGEWYWQSGQGIAKSDAPDISRDAWSMTVEGPDGVDETIDFDRLMSIQEGEPLRYVKTMRCVFGQSIGTLTDSLVSTGIFAGVPLDRVLRELGVSNEAAKLRTFGADGFESNLPMERALHEGDQPLPPMLAYRVNGRKMPRLRGGPVRLVVPEMWGYKNMKWLTRLKATEDDSFFGTYETEQFGGSDVQPIIDDPGRIALMSVVSKPTANATEVEGPNVTVAGTSFAGGTTIDRVEVALNDRSFETVELPDRSAVVETLDDEMRQLFEQTEQASGPWPPSSVWLPWTKTYRGLPTGTHTMTIRARDARGRTQPRDPDQPLRVAGQVRVEFTVT
jgi:DMSO/TMAO reductase YedYZ molybdopterin-dependent catalytic subunit